MKNIIFLTSVPRDPFCLCWEVRQHITLNRGCGALRFEAEQVPESSQRCSLLRSGVCSLLSKPLPLRYLSTRRAWKTYIWLGGTSVQGAKGPGMVRVRDEEDTDNGQGSQVTFPGSPAELLFSGRLGEHMLQWPLGWCAASLISLCLGWLWLACCLLRTCPVPVPTEQHTQVRTQWHLWQRQTWTVLHSFVSSPMVPF